MVEVLTNAASFSDSELHDAVVELRREIDRLHAREARLVAEWDARRIWADDGSKSPSARFARDTGVSPSTAKHVVRRARRLRSMFSTAAAFERCELSADRVDLLVRVNQPDVFEQFARDEDMLVSQVSDFSFANAMKLTDYWSQLANEDKAEAKAKKQVDDRELHLASTFGNAVDIRGLLDSVNGEIVTNEIQRIEQQMFEADWAEARAQYGDAATADQLRRTPAQRRADALVEVARRSASLSTGAAPARALITVLVGEKTFGRVCELASGKVIAPGQIVPLLGQADIERIVFDGPARVMEVGRKRLFTGALRRAIEVRDRTCFHPSCDEPASRCQVDHKLAYTRGGPTIQENGQLACPKHNRDKGTDTARSP